MKRLMITTVIALAAVACSKANAPGAPQERRYPMTATIVSRDPAKNTVNLDNKEVPGEMGAMTMDYEVRGARVASLPPDGTAVQVTVHDANGSFYVSDIRPKR